MRLCVTFQVGTYLVLPDSAVDLMADCSFPPGQIGHVIACINFARSIL